MDKQSYDFCGWATRSNVRCSDGRTIMQNAFADCNGKSVPLVWNHQHNEPENVLGHAMLENRGDGVYMYGKFNDTESGKTAKALVAHGDITAVSIYANQLKESNHQVFHGMIREVSLVHAGANPGAYIEKVVCHSDSDEIEEGVIYTGMNIDNYFEHADEEQTEETEQKAGEKTVADVLKTFSPEQKKVLELLVGMALEEKGGKNEAEETEEDEEEPEVKHNVFEQDQREEQNVLSHSEMKAIIDDAKRYGSLAQSALQHGADDYGIDKIEFLYPEAKTNSATPEFIQRKTDWVSKVMNGVHRTPFSRIKSLFADITADEARALGYMKGNKKKDEVFGLLKRTTSPTTIYKKQKIDRDDMVDITDFDVVAWIKGEMRMMLEEEIARAILVGDGRSESSDDKINEQCIRPVMTDDDLYNIKVKVNTPKMLTVNGDDVILNGTVGTDGYTDGAIALVDSIIRIMPQYRGSGNPTFYMCEDFLSAMLTAKDVNGHYLYKNAAELATTLRVKEIVPVPVMDGITDATAATKLMGVIVNLNDYNVGADKGGTASLFEDFDIDYNQMKYLIETRCSGALVKPKSAITVYAVAKAAG